MDPLFVQGNPEQALGHALLYFRDREDPSRLYATYVVVLPVPLDLRKYMPPLLAGPLAEITAEDLSAIAFPPFPEPVEYGEPGLQRLAHARGDDLLYGGEISPRDTPGTLARVQEAVQGYAGLVRRHLERVPVEAPGPEPAPAGEGEAVADVLYSLMGEKAKLEELARLLGKLRFAVEGGDRWMLEEAEAEVRVLARHLPERYPVERLLASARDPSPRGAELARLYLELCYRLAEGDEASATALALRIQALEQGEG